MKRSLLIALFITVAVVGALWLRGLGQAGADASYTIANSIKLASSTTDKLTFTPGSNGTGSGKIWTVSFWFKPGHSDWIPDILATASTTNDTMIRFPDDGTVDERGARTCYGNLCSIEVCFNSCNSGDVNTGNVLYDPTTWKHVVVAVDTTQADPYNRIKIYINGVQQTNMNPAYGNATYPSLNFQTPFNLSGTQEIIGCSQFSSGYCYDGLLADFYMIDGLQLDPTAFGTTDSYGYWRPKPYTGSFGTDGFHLTFSNGSSLGTDSSGNSNNWTVGGTISSTNQFIDSPTNNFATINPLIWPFASTTNANTTSAAGATSTIFMSTGKWYWEVEANASGVVAGVATQSGGSNTTSVSINTWMGFEFDADAGTLASTTDGVNFIGSVSGLTSGRYAYATGGSNSFNFGQYPLIATSVCNSSGFTYSSGTCSGFLTSGTTQFVVPTDWSNVNTVECIGSSGGGSARNSASIGGSGGGGGAYAKRSNITGLSGTLTTSIGAAAATASTTFNSGGSTAQKVVCDFGRAGATSAGGKGGTAGGSVGDGGATFDGGSGATATTTVGTGGGGSAGPSGAGSSSAGSKGGAGNNGTDVASALTNVNGTSGTEFSATHGAGSGASGRSGNGTGFTGGTHGGGGSGSGTQSGQAGGSGAAGIIYITYHTASSTVSTTYFSSAGGNFVYQPQAGYKALSSANLPDPTIKQPLLYFNALNYIGTGATQSVYTPYKTIFLTAGTTFIVPGDWNSSNNMIEVIGGGGGGGGGTTNSRGGAGGGGGAYASTTNVSLTPGNGVTIQVGGGGGGGSTSGASGSTGGDSWFNGASCAAASVCAKGGTGGTASTGGAGGAQASGVGNGYSGGSGGNSLAVVPGGGGGGGGAAGPFSTGASGGTNGTSNSGGGGGGADGGTAGSNGAAGAGGTGGNNWWLYGSSAQGAGGTSSSGPGGTGNFGGGGGGAGSNGTSVTGSGGQGGQSIEWASYIGSGGGGGAGSGGTGAGAGGTGGVFGGGGGGGGDSSTTFGAGGQGGVGVIRITYVPAAAYTFAPDIVWTKSYNTNPGAIWDTVRGATKYWTPSANTSETTDTNSLTAFLSNGFTLGSASPFNEKDGANEIGYYSWVKSATNGIDIVTYTGDNTANRNISHSLGAAPELVMVKRRDTTGDPYVWHTGLTGATSFLTLDSTTDQSTTNTPWGTGNFSSTQFMVTNNATNNLNASSGTYVAYLFRSIDGYSKFGTYVANGYSNGTFIYTSFKPAYVWVKRLGTADHWFEWDLTADGAYNLINATNSEDSLYNELQLDTTTFRGATGGGGSSPDINFVSNGFKLRNQSTNENATSSTYIYAAFAAQPFKFSAAPPFNGQEQSLLFESF